MQEYKRTYVQRAKVDVHACGTPRRGSGTVTCVGVGREPAVLAVLCVCCVAVAVVLLSVVRCAVCYCVCVRPVLISSLERIQRELQIALTAQLYNTEFSSSAARSRPAHVHVVCRMCALVVIWRVHSAQPAASTVHSMYM